MGKGEIAHYEQFLLFPQCFQKAYFPGASKGVIVWQWVKQIVKNKTKRKNEKKKPKKQALSDVQNTHKRHQNIILSYVKYLQCWNLLMRSVIIRF